MASSLQPSTPAIRLAETLSRDYLIQHRVCPLSETPTGELIVAVGPAYQQIGVDGVALAYGRPVQMVPMSDEQLTAQIERLTTATEHAIELARARDIEDDDLDTDIRDLADQAPVVRYVNLLVRDAFDIGASDIHLEATRDGLIARVRLDGVLVPALEAPPTLHQAIVSRVKLLANLDIAERRRPQDGRIQVRLEHQELDLRVSTVPTMFGESVVLRLLDRSGRPAELHDLGLGADAREALERLAARPHGMVLVTGPTGSGKTTTLYACLLRRAADREKIITVEDPVEYRLPGIVQVPADGHAGVTFANALRAILRQDPDVLMIGEMRDHETAEIGIQAAMTGHLVFSTLHTNDAIGAIPRLLDLGIPAYLISAVLDGVMAQRLVRVICDACRLEYTAEPDVIAQLTDRPTGRMRLQRGAGCAGCRGTGYRGRIGLFELVVVTDALRDAISRGASSAELREISQADGRQSLRSDGWRKVRAGITTAEEVLRVAQV